MIKYLFPTGKQFVEMTEAKLIVCASTTFSLLSVTFCLMTIPRMYREINTLYEEVVADVAQFRAETDAVRKTHKIMLIWQVRLIFRHGLH